MGGIAGGLLLLVVLVGGGPAIHALTTEPDPGRLRTRTNVTDGELWVDGTHRGAATEGRVLELPPGAHVVEVRVGNRSLLTRNVQVGSGAQQDVVLESPVRIIEGRREPGDRRLASGELAGG